MSGAPPVLQSRADASQLKLQREHAHPRDARITFREADHKYFLDGRELGLSVTGLLHVVESDEFDADAAAAKVVARAIPNPRYCDRNPDGTLTRWTVERIKASWSDANIWGTDLHGKIERFLNDEPYVDNGVNADTFAQFRRWYDANIIAAGYAPYRTEWVIYDEAADVAGSIDCVFRHTVTGEFFIVDWKRCLTGDGFDTAFRDKKLRAPCAHLPDTKRTKWCLQVNVYRDILERHYGLAINKLAMVVCHPDNAEAEVVFHPRSDAAVLLLNHRLRSLGREPYAVLDPVPVPVSDPVADEEPDCGRGIPPGFDVCSLFSFAHRA